MIDAGLFTAGSLFSSDYLTEAIRGTDAYAGVNTADLRARLQAIADRLPQTDRTNEAQTEDDFIWPVLAELGWADSLRQQNLSAAGREDVPDGVLFADAAAKARANAEPEQWRRYAHGLAAVESKRWARPLDRASGRDEATAPSTQMLRYLRRVDDLTKGATRWGILTNGRRWRLYWAGARSVAEEFAEVDLARALGLDGDDLFSDDAQRDHWLAVFATLFSRPAFLSSGADGRTFHERARAEAAFYEERVAASLSALVFGQVFPDLATALARAAPDAGLNEVRDATLILLYRLLFLLYAEDRDLLPVGDSRYRDYALRPLRQDIGRRMSERDVFSPSAAAIWSRVADLSRIINSGEAAIGIPPYNGGLFAADAAPILERVRIPDSVMAPALDALSFERSTGERRYINYRDLSVQQLGSIYERLLEHELVRDDGALAVRPNPFARKNTGSYYTPEPLVGLILTETLEPLLAERLAAFRTALACLNPKDAEDYRRRTLREVDPAAAILRLTVCDPAMGSGHFLVSLVDVLADRVLEALADAEATAADLDYRSPVATQIEEIRVTILASARDGGWSIDEAQLDDRHIVRRMVLKRCVFGVDKNPMAVELAKVALWLHTFTVGAPLSFLDHHLRAGDSLFGLWVRDAIDRATALGGGLLYAEALANAQRQARAMATIERATDADIAEAHRSAELWEDVESATGPLDGFVSFLHALDWLRLDREQTGLVRLWLDGRFGEPIPIARGVAAPEGGRARPEEVAAFTALWERARSLIAEERFLNWQVAFPGVWSDWGSAERHGGFDAVVGNPPWDRIKLQQVEWFAARRPEVALAARASERKRMIAALERDGDPLWHDFSVANQRASDTSRVARTSGQYPLLSGGDTNLNSLFVERAHALIRPNGVVGLLIPSGLASDQSSAGFFQEITAQKQVRKIIDFFNRRYDGSLFFPDVYYRFKFCAYIAGGPNRPFEQASYGFFIRSLDEVDDPDRVFPVTSEEISRINPNSGTAPIFRSRRDKEITSSIYARLPVLVDRRGDEPVATWPVRYATLFHMANDSSNFRTADELKEAEGAWPIGGNRWQSPSGEWVPLYEGKMVQAYDHRASDIVLAAENVFRPGQGASLSNQDHSDPARQPLPRYWVQSANIGWDAPTDWCLSIKDVTSVTNARTVISALIPRFGAGHTLPVLFPAKQMGNYYQTAAPLLAANFNSIVFDYVARQKVHGNHLAWYILEQLPVIPPAAYARCFGGKTAADIVREAVLELIYTARDLASFARDLGHVDEAGEVRPPFPWDEERRLQLRAKLDALFFLLTGVVDPSEPAPGRDDVAHIFSTFPIVEREETARWGRYRSRDLTLAWINALLAGQPDADIRD